MPTRTHESPQKKLTYQYSPIPRSPESQAITMTHWNRTLNEFRDPFILFTKLLLMYPLPLVVEPVRLGVPGGVE